MLAPVATILASFVASTIACAPSGGYKMTFYGWPDNSPPGPRVSMNCGGRNGKASGTGSYEDPLTMAAAKGRFSECELVYSPYLKKYLRMEDTCANCSGDWVDVWTGSSTSDPGSGVKKCQESLTGADSSSHTIIQTPPQGLEVTAAELYANGACNTAIIFPTNDKVTGGCSALTGATTGGSTTGSSTTPAAATVVDSADTADAPKTSSKSGRKGKGSRKWRVKVDEDDE